MENKNFTTTILVNKSPADVFTAIKNPGAWWSEEITGSASQVNDIFNYHYEDVHACKIKVIDVVPNQTVVWQVLENYFNFINDKTEWIDTKVVFEISQQDGKTKLVFTHVGLTPEHECYEACHQGWTHYIQTSLKNLINTGLGQPNKKGSPQTETEKKLTLN